MAKQTMPLQTILDKINDCLARHREKIHAIEAGGVWRGTFKTLGNVPDALQGGDALFKDLDINDLITIENHDNGGRKGVAIFRYAGEISEGYSKANFHFSHWTSVDYTGELEAIEAEIERLMADSQAKSAALSFGDANGGWTSVQGFSARHLKEQLSEDFEYGWDSAALG